MVAALFPGGEYYLSVRFETVGHEPLRPERHPAFILRNGERPVTASQTRGYKNGINVVTVNGLGYTLNRTLKFKHKGPNLSGNDKSKLVCQECRPDPLYCYKCSCYRCFYGMIEVGAWPKPDIGSRLPCRADRIYCFSIAFSVS